MGMYSNEEKEQRFEQVKVKRSARVEIYGLFDPLTNEIRYIGKANDSSKRLKSHLRDMNRRDYPVYRWMRKLSNKGMIPSIQILSTTNTDDWKEEEVRIIKKYTDNGVKLLNVAHGGYEPFCSTETRRSNGIKVARLIHDNPRRRLLWTKIKGLAQELNTFKINGNKEAYNRIIFKIKIKRPLYPILSTFDKYDYI